MWHIWSDRLNSNLNICIVLHNQSCAPFQAYHFVLKSWPKCSRRPYIYTETSAKLTILIEQARKLISLTFSQLRYTFKLNWKEKGYKGKGF